MNDAKVKELAIQAGLIAPYGSDREGLANFDFRQFAELIVRECTKAIVDDIDANPPDKHIGIEFNEGMNHAQSIILEHFKLLS